MSDSDAEENTVAGSKSKAGRPHGLILNTQRYSIFVVFLQQAQLQQHSKSIGGAYIKKKNTLNMIHAQVRTCKWHAQFKRKQLWAEFVTQRDFPRETGPPTNPKRRFTDSPTP